MSIVYRMSDTRDLKVDSLTVKIRPLDYKVKSDMQSLILEGKSMDAAILSLRHAIVDIKGLTLPDGSDYVLQKSENGIIDMDSVNDLLNIPESSKINLIAITLLNGMPQTEFTDPENGKRLQGVSFVKGNPSGKKPKRNK